jgi:hypothetical protein
VPGASDYKSRSAAPADSALPFAPQKSSRPPVGDNIKITKPDCFVAYDTHVGFANVKAHFTPKASHQERIPQQHFRD